MDPEHVDERSLDRLDELIVQVRDGAFDPGLTARLEAWIVEDPTACWHYVQSMNLHAGLAWHLSDAQMQPPDADSQLPAAQKACLPPLLKLESPYRILDGLPRIGIIFGAIVSCLVIVSAVVVWQTRDDALVASASETTMLAWCSDDCRWARGTADLLEGGPLEAHRRFQLEHGEVHLEFPHGVRMEVCAPAEFEINTPRELSLLKGAITAVVSESGRGFTLSTPNGKVVDCGTAFGVAVDDFGLEEAAAFQGKILAIPKNGPGGDRGGQSELHRGHALQWGASHSLRVDATKARFSAHAVDWTLVSSMLASSSPLIADDFDRDELDKGRWTSLGAVAASDGTLSLGGGPERAAENVPYLITTREIDPANGPIVITGTIHFDNPTTANSGSFSVLTRAQNERGRFPRPDYAHLATGVRATFWPGANVERETMRILVRPLAHGENVGLLGEDFTAGALAFDWSFALVDDGVNLLFRIEQLRDSSVQSTVACKSLFRGQANFIAFEGQPYAIVRIDNLRIYQVAAAAL